MSITPKSSKVKPAPAGTGKARKSAASSDVRVTEKVPKGESSIVRETFSLPPADSSAIEAVRRRGAVTGVMLNRSEVVRAGIAALLKIDEKTFNEIVSGVPKLKSGRQT
jgi:hypothetical protein